MAAWSDVAIEEILKMRKKIADMIRDAVAVGAVNGNAPERAQANLAISRLTVAVQHLSEALAALRQYARGDEKKEDPEEKEDEPGQ